MLGRKVNEAELKRICRLATKYCQGMLAQEAETTITVADCLDEFASGAFDGYLQNCRDISMSAFWPWVIQAKKDKQKHETRSEIDAALEAAARLQKESKELRDKAAKDEGGEATDAGNAAAQSDTKELQLLEAEKNVYRAQLRAFYAELQHFAADKMPEALKIWDAKAARLEADAAARARSMEEVAFVVVPQDEAGKYCAASWVAPNAPCLPVVAYIDLNQAMPELENSWAVLRETKGALLAFITGEASTMATMMQTEMLLFKSVPEDATQVRCFIRGTSEGGNGSFVGSAILVSFPSSDPPALRARMGSSQALLSGCLLNLPTPNYVRKVKDRTGHDVCPQQRAVEFHKSLLQGFNILTPLMASGLAAMDFFLMEPEACTSSLASLVAGVVVARLQAQKKAGRAIDTPRVYLATSLQHISGEARSSLHFREQLAAEARERLQPLADIYGARQLKRLKTNSEEELVQLATMTPSPPTLPKGLFDELEEDPILSGATRVLHLMPTGKEVYDGACVKPLPTLSTPKLSFDVGVPDALALVNMCVRGKVVVAPSWNVPGRMGLYPARKFIKGETI